MTERCHIRIWPHDPATRCTRERLHGGRHIAASGIARQSTAAEAFELLGLATSDIVRPITDLVESATRALTRLITQHRT